MATTTSINTPSLTFIASLFLYAFVFRSGVVLCQSVPGVYLFGDSLIDPGNNNYLPQSFAKANFPHNGVDFPTGPTGRFSNGKNAADFLAEKVGLPSAPPYLSLVSNSKNLSSSNATVTGISFASGGSGIFNGTGTIGLSKQTIPLTEQVEYYSVVHDQLVQRLGSADAQAHLSKSLFLIVIGSNDLYGYFNKDLNVSKQYTPQQYVDLMASTLKGLINKMHGLGACKFVVIGVGAIGCTPAQRKQNNTECKADINHWSVKYNDGLQALLRELKTELSDINYSYFDLYDATNDILQHPQTYGFIEIKAACCGLGNLNAEIPCIPISTFCPNRKNHLFWDLYHPTETASGIFLDMIYSGSRQFTMPMNVEQLVKA